MGQVQVYLVQVVNTLLLLVLLMRDASACERLQHGEYLFIFPYLLEELVLVLKFEGLFEVVNMGEFGTPHLDDGWGALLEQLVEVDHCLHHFEEALVVV